MDDEFKWYLSDKDTFEHGFGIGADGTAQPKEVAAFHAEKDEMIIEFKRRISLYENLLGPSERQRMFFCQSKGHRSMTILFGHIPSTEAA